MTQPTPPRSGRRATDRPAPDVSGGANLPVPAARPAAKAAAGAFDAQLLAQGTTKRGLRGGKEVLDAARSTYLHTEWSGPADRRPPPGLFAKTKI